MNSFTAAKKPPRADYTLLFTCLALAGIGLVMVFSASGIMAEKHFGDTYHFFKRQSLFTAVGLMVMAVAAFTPRALFYKLTYFWLALAVAGLVLTLGGPLAATHNGASRWLQFGAFSFQPLEGAKVALVLYLAYFFSTRQDKVKRFSIGFLPPFVVTGGLAGLLMLQPDFGGAAFLCVLVFLMSLAGGTRFSYLFVSFLFAAGSAAMLVVNSPYRFRRLLSFLDPFSDARDVGYQLVQSLYAFGSGGIAGTGLGAGRQKLFFLPEAHNDFIMAVFGEETGFIGISIFFLLVGLLLWRAFAVSLAQEDLRDRLAGYGMTLILALGVILNLAVVLGAAPPKGVPMPFVSYGGSQLLVSFFCAGMLLNLSRDRRARGGK